MFQAGYNGLDTRAWKIEGGAGTGFVRAGAGVTDPVLRDAGANYTPGISERRSGVTTFLHSGLKDATAQSSTSQVLTSTRVYDAFGMVASSTGTWKGPFGYAGDAGYQEDASGLQLLGHRYYDPSTGRFLTRDPAKDGRNWYGYCRNNPLNMADASGNFAIIIVAGVAIALVDIVLITAAIIVTAILVRNIYTMLSHPVRLEVGPTPDESTKDSEKPKDTEETKDEGFKKNIERDKDSSIEKGIRSRNRRIEEHQKKIEDDPNSRDRTHWEKEIDTFRRQNDIARKVLKDRGIQE